MLLDHQLKIADVCNISIGNVKEIVPNFFDKEKYVLHYKNLKLHLSLRLKIKKVRCVLKLDRSKWLKPYIERNTKNNVYGKCYIW